MVSKYFLSLVSKCKSVSISIFQFQLIPQISYFIWYLYLVISWFVDLRRIQNLYCLFTIRIIKFWLFTKVSQNVFHYLEKISNFVLKIFWYVVPICKGILKSLLHIDSCWVYLILRNLTTLFYAIHVCRVSFTSPLMHCILCVMWIRACHPFFM